MKGDTPSGGCFCVGSSDKSTRPEQSVSKSKQLLSQYDSAVKDEQILSMIIKLYLSNDADRQQILQVLKKCRLNPNYESTQYRRDLEYFIPQLINYLVFHRELQDQEILTLVIQAAQKDFYFAHLVYFQLSSLSHIINGNMKTNLDSVIHFCKVFFDDMSHHYGLQVLIPCHLLLNSHSIDVRESLELLNRQSLIKQKVQQGTLKRLNNANQELIDSQDIQLVDYVSIFESSLIETSFGSTISFWQDMVEICEKLSNITHDKVDKAREYLDKVNENLPSTAYIPFVLNSLRNYVILNVITEETRVFSTKKRSPFSICVEIFRPEEEESHEPKLEKQISLPIKIDGPGLALSKSNAILPIDIEQIRCHSFSSSTQGQPDQDGISRFYNRIDEYELSAYHPQLERVSYLKHDRGLILTQEDYQQMNKEIFGESSEQLEQRVRRSSKYKNLKTWKLAYLIIKSGDNLKQEQFALQLICQFAQIFRSEGLPLKLTYYEVLSIGPDSGIIQMVKNATTIDSLSKVLFQEYPQLQGFSDFFRAYFRDNIEQAINNYLHSLVAYCLVCYFLQIKDRHNGNILLDHTGTLIHIDFGFFLSNAPGKGLEFEKKVPFKLMTEHIQVLGGVHGTLFEENFRRLFFQGFKAAQKHQEQILILVKMMYTGHGTTLPCFAKGDSCISDLVARFNPKVNSDAELYVHTQALINHSLDNWRAKWYDKYQYFVQGIFY